MHCVLSQLSRCRLCSLGGLDINHNPTQWHIVVCLLHGCALSLRLVTNAPALETDRAFPAEAVKRNSPAVLGFPVNRTRLDYSLILLMMQIFAEGKSPSTVMEVSMAYNPVKLPKSLFAVMTKVEMQRFGISWACGAQ